jgi:hypothetical protein
MWPRLSRRAPADASDARIRYPAACSHFMRRSAPAPMAQPTLKQRKTFALIRIFGGMVAALYLSFVVVSNVLAGVPFEGSLVFTALIAVVGYGYAAWYLRDLSAVAREERGER